ncbi:hypothetical protein EDD86DRAFT_268925 [Gorgonomyces haynaldii]|nr:hypothetical protein EDD86DRAFT_268925 [Gorgonomyces haynaldii]
MASMRDAMKRLDVIYKACAPEAIEKSKEEASLDEFTRLRKNIHAAVRQVREQLSEREQMMKRGGTTTESAEASYRIRVAIKQLKEQVQKMQDIVDKEQKKKKKEPEVIAEHKEVLDLCKAHIEECENLEKRKQLDQNYQDRAELFAAASHHPGGASTAGEDPFIHTDLPDIDVEEDLKAIRNKNAEIDQDLDELGNGVARLREIAVDMGNELDRQNENLGRIDNKVENALDHVDNLNISLRKSLDGVMKGDKFMINCIMLCVLLALAAFISTQFIN